jgi:hypothetical protein
VFSDSGGNPQALGNTEEIHGAQLHPFRAVPAVLRQSVQKEETQFSLLNRFAFFRSCFD